MSGRLDTCIFVGRFQPLHKGHMGAIRYAASRCGRLVVCVGSAQERGTSRNPMPADDRLKTLRMAIPSGRICGCRISYMKVPDFMDDDAWFAYITGRVPRIDAVFSGNAWVRSIFRSRGIMTVVPPWHERKELSATRIRSLIRHGRPWKKLVPREALRELSREEAVIRSSSGRGRHSRRIPPSGRSRTNRAAGRN